MICTKLRLHSALIVIAATCFAFTLRATAQDNPAASATAPTNSASPATYSYDVVSIKPHKQADFRSSWRTSDDGFSAQGASLMGLVFSSYHIIMVDQIVGLPSWGQENDFDVDAKMDEQTAIALQKLPRDKRGDAQNSMLQQLLAERFQLNIHKETRELPIYNLVIAKGGLKMKASSDSKQSGYTVRWDEMSGDTVPIDSLIMQLSNQVHRVIANKTGLTGNYAIHLKWNPDPMSASANPGGSSNPDDALPDLPTALQEQLGLKLESAKGPVDVYVIDHVEKPSEN